MIYFKIQSLSEEVLSFKDKVLPIILPKLFDHVSPVHCYITWKINGKEILSEDCFVEFAVKTNVSHCIYIILKYLSVKLIYYLIYSSVVMIIY